MAHQISKYPLTTAERKKHNIPDPPKLISVVFEGCGHPAKVFETALESLNLSGKCWGCQKRFA